MRQNHHNVTILKNGTKNWENKNSGVETNKRDKGQEGFGWGEREEKGLRFVGQHGLRWRSLRRGTKESSKYPLGWKTGGSTVVAAAGWGWVGEGRTTFTNLLRNLGVEWSLNKAKQSKTKTQENQSVQIRSWNHWTYESKFMHLCNSSGRRHCWADKDLALESGPQRYW